MGRYIWVLEKVITKNATNFTLILNCLTLIYFFYVKVLNRDHGYPLRVVVPGVIGARSVKWLDQISIIEEECQGFFMAKDYKMFPPTVDWDNIIWSTRKPQMDFPVQVLGFYCIKPFFFCRYQTFFLNSVSNHFKRGYLLIYIYLLSYINISFVECYLFLGGHQLC
jgi:hypothetical protein